MDNSYLQPLLLPKVRNCEITQNCQNHHYCFKTHYLWTTIGHLIHKMCEHISPVVALFVWSHVYIRNMETIALLPRLISRGTLWHPIRNIAHEIKSHLLSTHFKKWNTFPRSRLCWKYHINCPINYASRKIPCVRTLQFGLGAQMHHHFNFSSDSSLNRFMNINQLIRTITSAGFAQEHY